MKKTISILVLFIGVFCFCCNGQEQKVQLNQTSQRAAEGQSKWMLSQFKLDTGMYQSIYRINLKYQLKTDSIHTNKAIASEEKRKLYLLFSKNKEEELQNVFTPEIFRQYKASLESVKQNAPRK